MHGVFNYIARLIQWVRESLDLMQERTMKGRSSVLITQVTLDHHHPCQQVPNWPSQMNVIYMACTVQVMISYHLDGLQLV